MRKRKNILLGLVMLVVSGSLVAFSSKRAHRFTTVVNDLSDMSNITPIDGSRARLVINDQGAALRVKTSELPAGHAVTVWWVVFNTPEGCGNGECGADDAGPPPGNPASGVSVSFAAGNVVGGSGKASFAGHLPVGDKLIDPRTAEFHFLIRDHGPAIPGLVNEQISTSNAGCSNFGGGGTYLCADLQGGIFGQ